MTASLVLATGLAVGVDWRLLALAAGAVWFPIPAAMAVGAATVVGWRIQSSARGSEARFAETVVGELRAGSSLRMALGVACGDQPETRSVIRRLEVGESLDRAVQGLGATLPTIGSLVEAAVTAGAGGGRMLPVFEELTSHAAANEAAADELRSALAPVRASMAVLVGGPVAYLAWAALTGRLMRMLSQPGGAWMAAVGGSLFLAGIGAMVVLARLGK